jgi:hypothetical protein
LCPPPLAPRTRAPTHAQSWLADATQNSSPIADALLKQLYHWVSNPGSAVHHPLLHRALLGVMQRLFVVLVQEMKALGATLVAANFNTLLIYTGRRNLTAAGAACVGCGRVGARVRPRARPKRSDPHARPR